GGAGGGAYLPCHRHGRTVSAARGRRVCHVCLARRQQHLRAQARTPAPERLGRSIAIPARGAGQSSPPSILPAPEKRFSNITKRRSRSRRRDFRSGFRGPASRTGAGKKDGPEGFAQFVKSIRSALPDLRAAIQNIVAAGDYVAMWNTATATHHGELFGIPPSGKQTTCAIFICSGSPTQNRRALELREHFVSLAKEIEGWQRI